MPKKHVAQPKWALVSEDLVVKMLIKANVKVTRKNYVRLAFLSDYEPLKRLPAELEMDLPEPLRMWDAERGCVRKHR